jgi:lysophospholipid acyltransferase (LPLAT)-like uncharacterized protein
MNFPVKIYNLLCKTLEISKFGEFFTKKPTVFLFWHSNFFVLPYAFKDSPVYVLVSPSRDGEIISRFLYHFNLGTIRSSQRRDRFKGLREMVDVLGKGGNIAITPDGPIGPRKKFKRGTISLLKALNVRVVFVGVAYSSFWELDTWDSFRIPMPFSKVIIYAYESFPKDEREAEGLLNLADSLARSLL